MIDIHAHLLPGVDDGPANWDAAVEMCRLAAADGVETVIATPHQRHEQFENAGREGLAALAVELQRRIGERPRVLLGGEIRVDQDILGEFDKLPGGSLLPLAGSRYLLLELPVVELGPNPFDLVHEVRLAGWAPVIAHPERVPWLAAEVAAARDLVAAGALMQVTAGAFTGSFTRWVQSACSKLMDIGLVHFVASDAHDPVHRPPVLSAARAEVERRWGAETARKLFVDHPRAVIENRLDLDAAA
jgi:protein-tyrosine phosphatase